MDILSARVLLLSCRPPLRLAHISRLVLFPPPSIYAANTLQLSRTESLHRSPGSGVLLLSMVLSLGSVSFVIKKQPAHHGIQFRHRLHPWARGVRGGPPKPPPPPRNADDMTDADG